MEDFTTTLLQIIRREIDNILSNHPILNKLKDSEANQQVIAPRYLTRKSAAIYLDTSLASIDRRASTGKLKKIYPFGDNTVRFDREEIDKAIREGML